MAAIGEAIEQSDGIVAVIESKFLQSTYCNNEVRHLDMCVFIFTCPNTLQQDCNGSRQWTTDTADSI